MVELVSRELHMFTAACLASYQAMASVADNVTGLIVELLKEKSMWNNTIFVVYVL